MTPKFNVAIQTYNLEKELHNSCLSCGEDIRHPLCPNCITKAFLQWTKKFPEHHNIKRNLNTFMRHHNKIKGKSKPCTACNNNVHICPYCFTDYLHKLIKESKMKIQTMTEFLFLFNFDFEHKGYSQELHANGGY